MTRYLADTTLLIDYLRDEPSAVARFEQLFADGDDILLNEVVVCETRAGLKEADVPAFAAMIEPAEFVQPGPNSASQAGAWRADLRRGGRVLSLADALIAAAAEAADATVLTRNVRDLSMTRVRVEEY